MSAEAAAAPAQAAAPPQAVGRAILRPRIELPGLGRLALGALVTVLYVFLLLPMAVVVSASFSPTLSDAYPLSQASLRWYRDFLAAKNFVDAMKFSLLLAAGSALAATAIGFVTAYGIVRYLGRRRRVAQSLALLPMLVPHILISLSLLLLLTRLPIPELSALVIGHVLICLPFTIAGIIASLESVDPDLEAAAYTLGASRARVLMEVTLPLVAPGVLSAAIFAFIVSFGDVDIALFLSGPGITTLPIEIFSFIQWESSPVVAAITTSQIALVILFGLVVERLVGLKTAMRV